MTTAAPPSGDSGRCARGAWCAWRITRWEDGQQVTEPAEAYRAFCDRDEELIGEYLADLPRLYLGLAAELGHLPAQPLGLISGSADAQVPLNLVADAVMRTTADVLISWHERVAAAAGLTEPKGRHPGWYAQEGPRAVAEACRVLRLNLVPLLALAPAWMSRRTTIAAAASRMLEQAADLAQNPDLPLWLGGYIHPGAGWADLDILLGGIHAGLEIIGLRARARRVLGETKPVPDELTGVRCKKCDRKVLYRADQADAGRSDSGFWSACGYCGHRMKRGEYDTWVRQWAVYEQGRLKARTAPVLENLAQHRVTMAAASRT